MIGVSGGRQSLYTSRPWGLKPLTWLHNACLKSRSRKKKSMTWTCILEPAAIRLTLERLQESARRSGYFLLAGFGMIFGTRNPKPSWSLHTVWSIQYDQYSTIVLYDTILCNQAVKELLYSSYIMWRGDQILKLEFSNHKVCEKVTGSCHKARAIKWLPTKAVTTEMLVWPHGPPQLPGTISTRLSSTNHLLSEPSV